MAEDTDFNMSHYGKVDSIPRYFQFWRFLIKYLFRFSCLIELEAKLTSKGSWSRPGIGLKLWYFRHRMLV